MALDDARLAHVLGRDSDMLVAVCTLPTATQVLVRARLRAARRRAARVSALIDHLYLAGASLTAAAAASMLLFVPLSDRVSVVVGGALVVGGCAVLAAIVAIRATSFERGSRAEHVGP